PRVASWRHPSTATPVASTTDPDRHLALPSRPTAPPTGRSGGGPAQHAHEAQSGEAGRTRDDPSAESRGPFSRVPSPLALPIEVTVVAEVLHLAEDLLVHQRTVPAAAPGLEFFLRDIAPSRVGAPTQSVCGTTRARPPG